MTLTPATLRLDACWEGYVQVGMKRKGKRRVPNCVPASSGVAKPRRQSDAETRMDPRTGQSRRRRDSSGMQFSHTTYIDPAAPRRDAAGKKYAKKVRDPKTGRTRTVRYGAKGYKIAPGTDKGDRYCARSFGDMKSHGKNCAGEDRNTPLCLSRAKWKCSGKTSRRDGLTPGKFSAW